MRTIELTDEQWPRLEPLVVSEPYRELGIEAGAVSGEKDKAAMLTEISLILAAVFWGLNFAATKYAAEFIPPLLLVAIRFTVGGLLMLYLLRLLEPATKLMPEDLLPMAGLGCVGVTISQTGFTFGISMTSAANTGLIFATSPVWGLVLGLVLGLERPTFRGVIGVALSIIGVSIIFYEGLGAENTSLVGDFLVLLGGRGSGLTRYSRCSCWDATRR